MTQILERYEASMIQTHLNQEQRDKFMRLETARATARCAWNAYRYGWRILATAETRYDGRTSLGLSSPAGGVRYSPWQQPTNGGRLEVNLYQTDLEAALEHSKHKLDHLDWLSGQRYTVPDFYDIWNALAVSACKFVTL